MNRKMMFIVNLTLTLVTCAVLMTTCGACSMEQLEHAKALTDAAQPAITAAGPALVNQPWYVFVLLSADIASSVIAALIAFKKKSE